MHINIFGWNFSLKINFNFFSVLDFNIEEYSKKKAELTTFLEKSQEKQKELEKSLEEFAKNAEIFCTKIANIQSKREEYSKKVWCLFFWFLSLFFINFGPYLGHTI